MVRSLFALTVLVAAGCSTVRIVKQPLSETDAQSITRELEGNEAAIKLRCQARSTDGTGVIMTPAAVEWSPSALSGQQRMHVPPDAIERITIRKRARGALDGFVLGLGTGAAVGLLAFLVRGGGEPGFYTGYAAVYAGVISAPLLAVVGAGIGHRYSIELAPSPPP